MRFNKMDIILTEIIIIQMGLIIIIIQIARINDLKDGK
jgi:hypothetical protein